jgi:hypothetical protein
MPTVDLPVFLFDVTSTDTPPRLVVTCRAQDAAQEMAVRLQALAQSGVLAGDEDFVVTPRAATATVEVIQGDRVQVQGYAIDTETLAAAINDAKAAAAVTGPVGAAQS